jgi:hypothetical protein
MRNYREIAAFCALQVICFLLLSRLEPDFFLLHFYQTIIYLAILIMLFYMEDRWAYMIGIVAPAMWLVMSFASGLLGTTDLATWQPLHLDEPGKFSCRRCGSAESVDDRGVHPPLVQRICRARQIAEHFCDYLRNRGGLLRHSGDLVLAHDSVYCGPELSRTIETPSDGRAGKTGYCCFCC